MRNLIYKTLNLFSPIYDKVYSERLRVLAYHDVIDPVNFEAQIKFLKLNYHIIDVPVLRKHLFEAQPLPPKSLLITFDDGDRSVLENALPILKKYEISVCLFIITELIDSNRDFWWDTIRKNEEKNGLSAEEIMRIINMNKQSSNKERLEYLKKYPITQNRQLTLEEVRELDLNQVYIANHSHSHPMFDKLQDEELVNEFEQVQLFFKTNKLGDFNVFAYPNGNYSLRAEKLLIENDIDIAFLFDHKLNDRNINPLRISRIAVDSDNSLPEFKSKVSGLHSAILKYKTS